MPLTPEDVRKKTFTPVRLREGYDMGEVDHFLDEVEGELTRLHVDIDDLHGQLSTTNGSPGSPAPTVSVPTGDIDSDTTSDTAPSGAVLPVVRSVGEASSAAARLLEIAAQNADQLVGEARDEADTLVNAARDEAEQLRTQAQSRAAQVEADARSRFEDLEADTSRRREQLLGDLERDKDQLDHELEDLRAFEREYRSRLKAYFFAQLQALDADADAKDLDVDGEDANADVSEGDGEAPSSSSGSQPRGRLRDLLSEEPQ